MATTRMKYDAASPHGKLMAEAVDAIIEARAKIARVKKAAESMSNGGDFASVELELGLDAGHGQDALYFLTSVDTALNGQPLNDILAQLDQG